MPLGQIDPARLSGEALRAWYSRTPSQIEDQRRQESDAQYRAFFEGVNPDRFDDQISSSQSLLQASNPFPFWGRSCQNCHGGPSPTFPPFGRPAPLPPTIDPRVGPRGKPRPRNSDACDRQLAADNRICERQPTSRYQGICYGSAMERYANCLGGRPDFPELDTIGRLNPR
jgi:hypothetical protein